MFKFYLTIVGLLLFSSSYAKETNLKNYQNKPLIESTKYFNINRIKAAIQNNGIFGRHPVTGNVDFTLDGSDLIYTSGLWMAAKVNGEVRASAADFITDYVGGAIDKQGEAYGKNDSTFRVYKISKGDNIFNNIDYAQWPTYLGAPEDEHGNPKLLGDQTLWCSFTDAFVEDRNRYNICPPLGAEVHFTIWGWEEIDNMVFLEWEIINKSESLWEETYFGIFSDPDIVDANDDLTGSDSTLNLVYCYDMPRRWTNLLHFSVGYQMLSSPMIESFGDTAITFLKNKLNFKNLPVYAPRIEKHNMEGWGEGQYTHETTASIIYNRLQCLNYDGEAAIDPTTNFPTKWAYSGDPISNTGWLDKNPRDRRMMLSTGPLNLAPTDTATIITAIFAIQKDLALDYVRDMKNQALAAKNAVENRAGIYSETIRAIVGQDEYELPVKILNFINVKKIKFAINYDTSIIKNMKLELTERTKLFTLKSNILQPGLINYEFDYNGGEVLKIGNKTIVNVKFDISKSDTEKEIELTIVNGSCLLENNDIIKLNDTKGTIILENLPEPPRLLTPEDKQYINNLTIHFSWTNSVGSDSNIFVLESNATYPETISETSYTAPVSKFFSHIDTLNRIDWTVKIVNYSDIVYSPDTFSFFLPQSKDLYFTQLRYNCQIPYIEDNNESIVRFLEEEPYLYVVQEGVTGNWQTKYQNLIVVELYDDSCAILNNQKIVSNGPFLIQNDKAIFMDRNRMYTYLVTHDKKFIKQKSFHTNEDLESILWYKDYIIGLDQNAYHPGVAVYRFNNLLDVEKILEYPLDDWRHDQPFVGYANKIIINGHYLYAALGDWGIFNIENPEEPILESVVIDSNGISFMCFENNMIYTGNKAEFLNIYDVENVNNPILIHSENLGQTIYDLKVFNGIIYIKMGGFIHACQFERGRNLILKGVHDYNLCTKITNNYIYDYSNWQNFINIYENNFITNLNINKHNFATVTQLLQNYPNPFNSKTTISYQIVKDELVVLKIFNILGEEIETLINKNQSAGRHKILFDSKNLPSGIYFYQLKTSSYTKTKKFLLLK